MEQISDLFVDFASTQLDNETLKKLVDDLEKSTKEKADHEVEMKTLEILELRARIRELEVRRKQDRRALTHEAATVMKLVEESKELKKSKDYKVAAARTQVAHLEACLARKSADVDVLRKSHETLQRDFDDYAKYVQEQWEKIQNGYYKYRKEAKELRAKLTASEQYQSQIESLLKEPAKTSEAGARSLKVNGVSGRKSTDIRLVKDVHVMDPTGRNVRRENMSVASCSKQNSAQGFQNSPGITSNGSQHFVIKVVCGPSGDRTLVTPISKSSGKRSLAVSSKETKKKAQKMHSEELTADHRQAKIICAFCMDNLHLGELFHHDWVSCYLCDNHFHKSCLPNNKSVLLGDDFTCISANLRCN